MSKKIKMTEHDAIEWVRNRMCYGRYIPHGDKPYVHDECQ